MIPEATSTRMVALSQKDSGSTSTTTYTAISMCPAGSHGDASLAVSPDQDDDSNRSFDSSNALSQKTKVIPVPVPEERSLYQVPQGLYLENRPLPLFLQLGVWFISACLSALSTFQRFYYNKSLAWILRPMITASSQYHHHHHHPVPWSKLLSFLVKTTVMALALTFAIQDLFLPPTRMTTQALIQEYFLPSIFSRYDKVALPSLTAPNNNNNNTTLNTSSGLGVHYLYVNPSPNSSHENRTGVIYLNHGFGASSLSWLPVVKPLVETLGYRCLVAHDTPGFGFTDRPREDLEPYTTRGSSAIGTSLLTKFRNPHDQEQNNNNNTTDERVLLMGHSMGSVIALRMALQLPPHVEKRIVLVDPALGMRRPNTKNGAPQTKPRPFRIPAAVVSNWFQRLVNPLAVYTLRRIVGRPGFWKRGLQFAWGGGGGGGSNTNTNTAKPYRGAVVTNADVLRYQWPALMQGWERGILAFSRAQFIPMERTDRDLLEQVLSLPNTTVDVIFGSNDKVIKPSTIRSFFAPYPHIRLVELPGLGHDPFEEDVALFMAVLKRLLAT